MGVHVSLCNEIDACTRCFRAQIAMDTPSAPSFSLNTKSWHESCRTEHFSVRPRRSHFSVPTAVRLRRREHGGRLCHAGGEGDHHRMGLPASTSHVPYSVW